MVIIYILIPELDNSDLNQGPRSNPDPDVFHIILCQDFKNVIVEMKSCPRWTTRSLQSSPFSKCYEVS